MEQPGWFAAISVMFGIRGLDPFGLVHALVGVAALIVGEGYNHFEIEETFGNPSGLMGRAALEQMKLTPA
jgi:hypothetical protein